MTAGQVKTENDGVGGMSAEGQKLHILIKSGHPLALLRVVPAHCRASLHKCTVEGQGQGHE